MMAKAWAAKLYNSHEWKSLREQLIIKANYTCSMCGANHIFDPWNLIGHHRQELTPTNVNDPLVSLNPANVDIVCKQCHDRVHLRYGFNGKRKVYLVYGAPCSGKTTFVEQIAERGDLIVDINEISRAISGCTLYDKPEKLNRQVYAIRDLLIDQIRTRTGQWTTAFIVGGYPHKLQREQLAEKVGAELVYIDVTSEEAILRAKASRGVMARQYESYIEKWFLEYQC